MTAISRFPVGRLQDAPPDIRARLELVREEWRAFVAYYDDVWDIAAVTALFTLSNRLAHAADIRPNPEFHTMGRTPPAG